MVDSQSTQSELSTPPTTSPSKSIRHITKITIKPRIPTLKKAAQLVTLYAGKSKEKFIVHKEFACHYSPVLDAAFKSDFVEGQTQEYRFEDSSVEAVRLLVHWFYTQMLDIIDPTELVDEHVEGVIERALNQDMALIKLWVLAEKLLIPRLQNFVIDEMERCGKIICRVPVQCFKEAYEKTSPGSPLRRFLVDDCGWYLVPEWYSKESNAFPSEMLIDLVTKLADTVESRTMAPGYDMTRYYVSEA
ncbi:hypothetical protein BKA64DRAFT_636848 [Cadophora sp. MPI-SDFR-AT-0126]|nr:hypothetical protein BKA64DRAFT_636848 [Leotiomycetes sp. MPI-SDFR-AT-0126]